MKKFFLLYFFFLFSFLSFFSSGTIESQDGQQYLAVARNMYYERWPTAPAYEYDKGLNIHMNVVYNAKDGKYYSGTGLGYSVALLPAVIISDIVHRAYDVTPVQHFPLESDWVVLFVASFTNAFFGALLGVVLYAYLKEVFGNHRQALIASFFTIVATNISAYTKHGFAHLMFATFLFASFYFVRKASKGESLRNLVLAGAAFGITGLSYNPIFILTLPALIFYFFLLNPVTLRKESLKDILQKMGAVFFGGLPFGILFVVYNYIRLGSGVDGGYGIPAVSAPGGSTLVTLFESLWGYFFSSGRSIFLYTPLLLLPVIFWHKLSFAGWKAEAKAFSVLIATFLLFYGTHRVSDGLGWAGESSWGPRYLMFLIPFAMFSVVAVWRNLVKKEKLFVALPLLILSIYIQLLGVLLPYEIKFAGVAYQTYIGDVRLTTWDYGNFLPRFSPIIKQTKHLGKRILLLASDHNHGQYNVRLFDGFEGSFSPWPASYWRGIHGSAVASYELRKLPATFELEFANTQIGSPSGYIAKVQLRTESEVLGDTQIAPEKWQTFTAQISDKNNKNGKLFFDVSFVGTDSAQQKVFLKDWKIDGQTVPLQTIDQPYGQPLAEKMSGDEYYIWGSDKVTNWDRWYMRSSVYQNTFDLWWMKPLYYWDLPKGVLWSLLGIDVVVFMVLARKLLRFKVQ